MKLRLFPTLFLTLEFFILLPSLLFVLGIILALFHSPTLIRLVIISEATIRNLLITVASPIAGGFFAYQYLERYRPKKTVLRLTQIILAYSIIEIGIVSALLASQLFHI